MELIVPAVIFVGIIIVGAGVGTLVSWLADWPLWIGGVAALMCIIPGKNYAKKVGDYYEKQEEWEARRF